MVFVKCIVLTLVASVIDSAWRAGDPCTKHTDWQKATVESFHKNALYKSNMKFNCYCAERAEGIAWAIAMNANTDDYSYYYDIYTARLTGRPLQNQYHQLRCMLDMLRNQEDLKNVVVDGRTYGCSYSRFPDAPKMADNVSQAFTCIYLKQGDKCV